MKTGNWKDWWHPEYYAGMIAGIGVGLLIATILLTPEHRVSSFPMFILAFVCIIVGSTLAATIQRNRVSKDSLNHEKHDA